MDASGECHSMWGLRDVKIKGVDLLVQSCLKIIISKCIVICSDFQVIYCIIFV